MLKEARRKTKTPGALTPGVLVTKSCERRFTRFGDPLIIASFNPSLNGRLMLVQSLANPLNHGAFASAPQLGLAAPF